MIVKKIIKVKCLTMSSHQTILSHLMTTSSKTYLNLNGIQNRSLSLTPSPSPGIPTNWIEIQYLLQNLSPILSLASSVVVFEIFFEYIHISVGQSVSAINSKWIRIAFRLTRKKWIWKKRVEKEFNHFLFMQKINKNDWNTGNEYISGGKTSKRKVGKYVFLLKKMRKVFKKRVKIFPKDWTLSPSLP